MSQIKRCALLDTDFISKLYITKVNDSDRLIFRILDIENFNFVCHQQTSIELGRHNQWASKWLDETTHVNIYTDRELLELLVESFDTTSFGIYVDMLKRSCDIFSQNFFNKYYVSLAQYVTDAWGNYDIDRFIAILQMCDAVIGEDNNLGEIKLYTMAQVFERIGTESIYIFCSDDRKARYALSGQADMECVSALGSFYLAKKYLQMTKAEAQLYFDSWMAYHRGMNQESFRIYNSDGHQQVKLNGQDIFDMLYDGKVYLVKDGLFREA